MPLIKEASGLVERATMAESTPGGAEEALALLTQAMDQCSLP